MNYTLLRTLPDFRSLFVTYAEICECVSFIFPFFIVYKYKNKKKEAYTLL